MNFKLEQLKQLNRLILIREQSECNSQDLQHLSIKSRFQVEMPYLIKTINC